MKTGELGSKDANSIDLILQMSSLEKHWSFSKYRERVEGNTLKLSIQDVRSFPSLKENLVNLDEGHFHMIKVLL